MNRILRNTVLGLIHILVLGSCLSSHPEKFIIHVSGDLRVGINLPLHCRTPQVYHNPTDLSGQEFRCAYQGMEYQFIIGSVHPENKYFEGYFSEPSQEDSISMLEDLRIGDPTIENLELKKHYILYVFQNKSAKSIYYRKTIHDLKTNQLLALEIKKRTGLDIMDDIAKVKKIGQSFKVEK